MNKVTPAEPGATASTNEVTPAEPGATASTNEVTPAEPGATASMNEVTPVVYAYFLLGLALIAIIIAIIAIEFINAEANHNELWINLQAANICMSGVFGILCCKYMDQSDDPRWHRVYMITIFAMLLLSSSYSISCIRYHEDNVRPSMAELMATGPPGMATPFYANHLYAMRTALVVLGLGMAFTFGMDVTGHGAHHKRTYMMLGLVVPVACLLNVTGRSPGDSGIGVNRAFLCRFSSTCPSLGQTQ